MTNEKVNIYLEVIEEWAKLEIEKGRHQRAVFLCELKVVIKELMDRNNPKETDGAVCPVCGWTIINREGNKDNYCRHCGQRLR